MKKLLALIHVLIFPCMALAGGAIVSIGPFLVDSRIGDTQPKKEVVVENLPIFFSSGLFNLCSPLSATFLLQKYACDNSEELKDEKCENLENKKTYSPFGLMRFYRPLNPDGPISNLSYNRLPINKEGSEFELGVGPPSLYNARNYFFNLHSNACFPFDEFVSRVSLRYKNYPNGGVVFFNDLNKFYKKAKEKFVHEGGVCKDCLTESDQDYKNIASLFTEDQGGLFFLKFRRAILKETLEDFLYSIFFAKCSYMDPLVPPPRIVSYNEGGGEGVGADQLKGKIIENIDRSKITMLNGLCVVKTNPNDLLKCKWYHSLVVTGYRNYLLDDSIKTYFQVKQGFGDEFAKKFGWVDADVLLSNVSEPGKKGVLMWLEKP